MGLASYAGHSPPSFPVRSVRVRRVSKLKKESSSSLPSGNMHIAIGLSPALFPTSQNSPEPPAKTCVPTVSPPRRRPKPRTALAALSLAEEGPPAVTPLDGESARDFDDPAHFLICESHRGRRVHLRRLHGGGRVSVTRTAAKCDSFPIRNALKPPP